MHAFDKDPNIFLSGSSDLTSKIWDIRVKNPAFHTFKGNLIYKYILMLIDLIKVMNQQLIPLSLCH